MPKPTPAASPLAPLTRAQFTLLLGLARGQRALRTDDRVAGVYLTERGLAAFEAIPGRPRRLEITAAGRRLIAMTNRSKRSRP